MERRGQRFSMKRSRAWERSLKEGQKREHELVQPTAELQTATRVDKGTNTEFPDCFNAWVQICDAADEIHERKSLQEEELKQCFDRLKLSWEATARKTEVHSSQRSNTKGQNVGQEWDAPLNLTKEDGWAKDREEMARFWGEKKFGSSDCRPRDEIIGRTMAE